MNKIINAKKYDTENAKLMDRWDNGCGGNDFQHCIEDLYRKETGEYFLHIDGGPLSPYAIHLPNGDISGSEDIIPMTEKEAREWAEEHLSADAYEAIFGEIEEESYTSVTISLPIAIAAKARVEAEQSGKTLSEYIADCI